VKQEWFERLTEVMARMAAGDTAALEALYVGFGNPIRSLIHKELRRLGVRSVDSADVDGLTLDVCTELYRRAGSWDPAHGVAPWTWARLRVRAIVCAYVGQFTDPLPEGGPADAAATAVAAPPAGDDENVVDTLERLAALRHDLRLRLLAEALNRVSRPAQQEILFEVNLLGKAPNDPMPPASNFNPEAGSCRMVCQESFTGHPITPKAIA
jgi:hypothetical protein